MKQVRPVEGKTLAGFANALNEAYAELSRFEVYETERIPGRLEALIYYEYPDELPKVETGSVEIPEPDYIIEFADKEDLTDSVTIRVKVGDHAGRKCCDCDNYDWNRGCPYRDGLIRPLD